MVGESSAESRETCSWARVRSRVSQRRVSRRDTTRRKRETKSRDRAARARRHVERRADHSDTRDRHVARCARMLESLRYTPSALEAAWSNATADMSWCTLAKQQAGSIGTTHSNHFALRAARGPTPRQPSEEERRGLSWHSRSGCMEPIEPLTGTARHPSALGAVCRNAAYRGKHNLDITHLVLANQCGFALSLRLPSNWWCRPRDWRSQSTV